jgi:hypothetical protein
MKPYYRTSRAQLRGRNRVSQYITLTILLYSVAALAQSPPNQETTNPPSTGERSSVGPAPHSPPDSHRKVNPVRPAHPALPSNPQQAVRALR